MSAFRKTVLTTAIIGAGLASTTGAAFANGSQHDGQEHGDHHASGTCSNTVKQLSDTAGKGGGRGSAVDVAGGAQTAAPINACDILNDNKLLNNIHVSIGDTVPTLPPLDNGGDLGGLPGDTPAT